MGSHTKIQYNMKHFQGRSILIYWILVLAFYLALIGLHNDFHLSGFNGAYLRKIVDSMFLALPVLFCKRKYLIFSYLFIADLYLLSIIWYFRTYSAIMPLSSYLMIDNLDGLAPSIWHSIHLSDLKLVVPLLAFSFFYLKIYNKISSIEQYAWKNRWMMLFCVLVIVSFVSAPYLPNKRPYFKQPFYLYKTESVAGFKKYGVIHYWIYQCVSYCRVSDDNKKRARDFMARLSRASTSEKALVSNGNKNLILILVESFQSWTIGLTVGEIEVTPNINSLLEQENVAYFPKEMPQVKDGRSSDAQLIINTGLLPLNTGAAASLYATNTFPSLASALKERKYYSVSFICDKKSFWNQGVTTIAYGFDKLYDQLQGDEGREKADENLFKKAIPIMQEIKSPFYAQLVTLSSHEPYLKPIMNNSRLLGESFKDDEVKNYLVAIQYVDKCIAEFIDGLKRAGLYDNSIIVITGDHEQMTYNKLEGRQQLEARDCFVPFIVINSPLKSKHTDKVIGQIDIYTSLLSIIGCNDYFFKGLGENVFGDSISNYVSFRTGTVAGNVDIPDSIKKYKDECWEVSDVLLKMNYFK